MTNVAMGKPIEEQHVKNSNVITNGIVTGYTDSQGFGYFNWPGFLTLDLGERYTLYCIRILLWDGLGEGPGQRNNRIYKYRLLTSVDRQNWKVVFDTANDGFNGWQVFNFPGGIDVRYLRIHGLLNTANLEFHIVEIEAHDTEPPNLDAEYVLQRSIRLETSDEEIGDGLPLTSRVGGIINNIEQLVEASEYLNPKPFKELISQLRVQVNDVSALERSMDSIRREIIDPVHIELEKSSKLGKFSVWGFWVGIIGGILAIISLILTLMSMFVDLSKLNVP